MADLSEAAAADGQPTAEDRRIAGELESIMGEALDLEGLAGAARGAAALPAVSTADELREALDLARTIGKAAFSDWPAYGVSVWSDPQLAAIAQHGGAIMDRNGWTMGELWSTWGPYIGLLGALAPPSLATYAHIKQQRAEAAARERARREGARRGPTEDADGVRP